MLKIDFYVQHLLKHSAKEIELNSGQPVRFGFPGGDRRSNTPIDQAQIAQLVQEAAPNEVLVALKRDGQATFRHSSSAGVEVEVSVWASGASWRVLIAPPGAAEKAPKPPADPTPPAQPEAPIKAAELAQDDGTDARHRAKHPSKRPPTPQVELATGEPKINRYLRMMAKLGASDLHLSAGVKPMVRLSGEMQVLEERAALTSEETTALLREIMPERNREQFDKTNDTDFAHNIEGVSRFRANVFADRKGPGGVFRSIPFEILTAEQLGVPKQVLDLCWLSKGLVVVTGPTGSGKSTTLAALIDYINENRSDHIITIEDPIEFVHPNKKCLINQREVGVHTAGFKNALKAALREDPDIVLVGEMRDLETISIAIETAETGHLVFGTLHTTTAPSTVDRIIDQFPTDRQSQIRVMLSESLRGVIAQVLCKKIGGGRAAAYEILISNTAMSNLIREGKTYQLPSVMQTGKKQGMQTMNEHMLRHVKDGKVDPQEAYIKAADKIQMKEMLARENFELKL